MINKYGARKNVTYTSDPWPTREFIGSRSPISKLELRFICYIREKRLEQYYSICKKVELALTIDECTNTDLLLEFMLEKTRKELEIEFAAKKRRS